ncbi:aminotransferase class I/II-fold pyridoxal phosphate-dependent enzyme [Metallumcola ferriviriculae]|uniref:Aminotransferase class I/II-fold pyridoxal phosphate-dependent enzyme n=1 Tax=Metallumcola ferriviriculae TaxID=3039180 RepID=A0AAU0UNB8_9FIRM|nr:aminotransferase class I/II-fold pyridoxal phosphate-dependent enzyme [Desulfitibacteraceae bacterium MK1]
MERLRPFSLERWFAQYEFTVDINLCASCASTINTGYLLNFGGDKAKEAYLSLSLDYIESNGGEELRCDIASQYCSVASEDVFVTTGASEAITILMLSEVNSGEEIVVQWPIYQSLYAIAESLGANIKRWCPSSQWQWDLKELERVLSAKVSMLIINSPHSPTGHCFMPEEMQEIANLAAKYNTRLVIDEVYRGISYDTDNNKPGADLSPGTVSIGDLTKPYGLGGLRVGWIASTERDLLRRCAQIRDYTTMCCAAPSEFLAGIALRNRERILFEKIMVSKRNIQAFAEMVERHSDIITWKRPLGGFTAFPFLKIDMDSEDFCRLLVEREDVLLLPGNVFGYPKNFRIGFGMDEETFNEGLKRLEVFLSFIREGQI